MYTIITNPTWSSRPDRYGCRYSQNTGIGVSEFRVTIIEHCCAIQNQYDRRGCVSDMLSEGDPAPAITAPNQHGETVSPDFSTPTVVYFYQQDGAPGCHVEAQQFQADMEAFETAGVTVYGVSTNSVEQHAEFAEELGLTFDLLSDPEGRVASAFGLDVVDEYNYIERNTFVLTNEKLTAIVDVDNINPDGHADEVLATAQELTS
jgi:peroxiredoxin Q/BCP